MVLFKQEWFFCFTASTEIKISVLTHNGGDDSVDSVSDNLRVVAGG